MFINTLYYRLKPFIPRRVQIAVRRRVVLRKRAQYSHVWPIDERAARPPEGWTGWPEGKKFALVLTHDVESAEGQDKVINLVELEKSLGFRSSFNFIADEYRLFPELRAHLDQQGFEVGIHGLRHSQNLYRCKRDFQQSAERINQYLREWKCVGFRSPSMYHNLDWIGELNIQYDSSTFDTDPFEPQSDGVGTIFPFWVPGNNGRKGYVELPYTLPQDFALFVLMKEKGIDIWKKKIDWIAEHGGMALLITHPDYMTFERGEKGASKYPADHYREFLEYIEGKYRGRYWNPLPVGIVRHCQSEAISKDAIEVGTSGREMRRYPQRIVPAPQQSRKKIWIDLDNSPHVPFFHPIIRELKSRGCEVILTTRDCSQTCGLADLFDMKYRRVGRHYGKKKVFKVAGTVFRSLQLSQVLKKFNPDIAVSHGSRAQMLSAQLLGVPSLVIMDYEYVKGFIRPTWIMLPEIIPDGAIRHDKSRIVKYPGIKEDVYVPGFEPDPGTRGALGVGEDVLMVTIRPPATEAHYHNPESEALFLSAVNYLADRDNVKMVILPRYDGQRLSIMNQWPEWCEKGKILIPGQVVDGLNLIWASDFVISGGGTMNREAAALGVPVYSIFRGKIGAVDRYLSEKGRLILLERTSDIVEKIKLVKRDMVLRLDRSKATLNVVVGHILKALET